VEGSLISPITMGTLATKKKAGTKTSLDTTLRCNNRYQVKKDDHMLKNTARMAEIHNLETTGNKLFVSFSDSRITSNLDKLGISLGRDNNVIRSSSVAIRNIEIDRLVVSATHRTKNTNKNMNSRKSSTIIDYSDEDEEERLEATLSQVCGDIHFHGDSQEHSHDHVLYDLKLFQERKGLILSIRLKMVNLQRNYV
jgi:hypothetical protein